MLIAITSVILLAAIPTPAAVHVTLNDLLGTWVTVSGDCSQGQHFLGEKGKYKVWCFDSISEGQWSLRNGNKIIVKLDPKTNNEDIITVVRVERYSDHTVLEVRYLDGAREKWMK